MQGNQDFLPGSLESKFILRLYKSGTLKVEIHICPAPTVYPDLVRKLGDFCYRSPKEFDTSVETRCVCLKLLVFLIYLFRMNFIINVIYS